MSKVVKCDYCGNPIPNWRKHDFNTRNHNFCCSGHRKKYKERKIEMRAAEIMSNFKQTTIIENVKKMRDHIK